MERRVLPIVALGVLLCSAVPFGVVTAAESNVAIANVTATPDQPAPDEQFTVETTITNAQNSEAFDVERVTVETNKGVTKAIINDPGTIPVGASMTVPLTMSLGSTGSQSLRVEVEGESASGTQRELRYPLSVIVRRGGPQLEMGVGKAAVNAPTPVEVTVSNGEQEAIRNLDVRLKGESFDTDGARRINATLDSGSERTFTLKPTPTTVGMHNLTAVFRFTTPSGENRVVRETRTVDVQRLRQDVSVSARVEQVNGSTTLPVKVQNFGNAPLAGVVVSARDDETTLGRESAGTIEPNGSKIVQLPMEKVSGEEIDVTATYLLGDQRRSEDTTVAYDALPGSLDLTGTAFERDSDVYRITGSASNLGLTDVDGAIVSVQSADGVTPRGPSKEYFIGTVEASDFVTFELTAALEANTTAIPIDVSYLVDGERVNKTVLVERDVSSTEPVARQNNSNDGSGGLLVPAIVTLVVLALIAVSAVIFVRRYNDGD
ncbi:hypothetical protein SAMN04487950_3908 [Halogranum rubrum]|uniref:CARDB protein n=1 Tax=Halogranum rubrum TaxID=553466 RepID=A0A1I4HZD4_9EURY|nr:hypothetical protein [Halogranum rubrum]SFL46866.1 hypothetical protein SAMN04487950_3908 [Halogranum rubrum]